MKTLLLFPPVMWNFGPYLSLPALSAYLRREGHEVDQIDLNAQLHEEIFSRQGMARIYREALTRKQSLESQGVLGVAQQEAYLDLVLGPVRDLTFYQEKAEEIKSAFRRLENYRLAPGAQRPPLELHWEQYAAIKALVIPDEDFIFKLPDYSLRQAYDYLNGRKKPLYLDLLRELVGKALATSRPELVGISFSFSQQIFPGLLVAQMVKQALPKVHLSVGGPIWTQLRSHASDMLKAFPFIDSMGLYEGEQTMVELVERLERGRSPAGVCNLLSRDNPEGLVGQVHVVEDLDLLPCPDYQGLDLSLYFLPYPVITYASARGCYYNKCAFCNFHSPDARFRTRAAHKVGQDLANLKNLSNAFYFSQECETPQRLAEISDQIMAQGLDIKYQVFARLDKRFSREIFVKLQRSGCQYVFFGLESGSQRVNNIINKGVDLRHAKRILADCHAAGQNVVVSSIKGFPTERPEEFKSTQDFYQTLYKNYGQDIRIAGSSHFFRLARDSRVDKKPEHFGLDHVWRSNAGELAMNYPSYRLTPEHRNGELSQSLREYHAQLPHIVFNEHVVLIINAINGSRAQALRTTGPRPQTPAKTALDAGKIESGRFLLSEQTVLLECAFNLVDLQKRSNSRRPLAEVQFYDQGRSPGEILARMEKDEPPLEKHEILLAANPARGKARALNARLACLLRACVHPRSFSQLLEDMPGLGLPAQAEGLAKLLSGLVQTGVLKLC